MRTSIQCVSKSGPSRGLYYTAGGYFLRRDDFSYADGSDEGIPDCKTVNFPEGAGPADETPCAIPTLGGDLALGPCELLERMVGCLGAAFSSPLVDECEDLDDLLGDGKERSRVPAGIASSRGEANG